MNYIVIYPYIILNRVYYFNVCGGFAPIPNPLPNPTTGTLILHSYFVLPIKYEACTTERKPILSDHCLNHNEFLCFLCH